jgi:hypothetical protein
MHHHTSTPFYAKSATRVTCNANQSQASLIMKTNKRTPWRDGIRILGCSNAGMLIRTSSIAVRTREEHQLGDECNNYVNLYYMR